jgi:hypothetical protein
MSCQDLARLAFKALRGYLEKGTMGRQDQLNLKTKLTVRQSTGKPKEMKPERGQSKRPIAAVG